jgi:integrase
MAKQSHIYKRGNQYWYRTSVTVARNERIDVRLSLLTDSLFVSKRLCSILDAARAQITGQEQWMFGLLARRKDAGSNPVATIDDIKPLVKSYFASVLHSARSQRSSIEDSDWHAVAHRLGITNFDYCNLLLQTQTTRSSVNWPRVEDWLAQELEAGNTTPDRAREAMEALKARERAGDTYPFSAELRDRLASSTQRRFDTADQEQLDTFLLEAARAAWFKAECERQQISMRIVPSTAAVPFPDFVPPFTPAPEVVDIFEFPAVDNPLAPPVDASSNDGDQLGDDQPTASPGCGSAITILDGDLPGVQEPAVPPPAKPAPVNVDFGAEHGLTFAAALEEFFEHNRSANAKREYKSEAQVRAMAKVLFFVVGGPDRPISILKQLHLGKFVATLRRLPTQWGKSVADQEGGIQFCLERAKSLPADEVGISATTEGRHLTMLNNFIQFSARRGFIVADNLNVTPLRKERSKERNKRKKKRGRVNWTWEEVLLLLLAPPYTGSKGPKRCMRYRSGKLFYWDTHYWMVLLLILYGFRPSEAGGLWVEHIKLDQPIPTILIRPTKQRDTKNENSIREVPIHPELLRLGFAEFVRAVSAAGHQNLFPDLVPTSVNKNFASMFYPALKLLRKKVFPNGTSARVRSGGRVRDKDAHSFRGFVITRLLKARHSLKIVSQIVGHDTAEDQSIAEAIENEKINPTTLTYCDEPTLESMLEAMETLTPITKSLQPLPAKLNPLIYGARKAKR